MDIHDELRTLATEHELEITAETESVPADEFQEIRQFLEGTRHCYVGGFVYNNAGEVLLIRHEDEPGWIQPGGMVESGETLEAALRREVREETGIDVSVEDPLYVWRGEYVHGDETEVWYSIAYFASATEPTIGDELGLEEEPIVEADWFEQLPENLHELATRERFRRALTEIDNRV